VLKHGLGSGLPSPLEDVLDLSCSSPLEQASEKTSENDQPPVVEVEDKPRRGRRPKKQLAAKR
jgi:hypothetical protein